MTDDDQIDDDATGDEDLTQVEESTPDLPPAQDDDTEADDADR